jgi:hypothetical protein
LCKQLTSHGRKVRSATELAREHSAAAKGSTLFVSCLVNFKVVYDNWG